MNVSSIYSLAHIEIKSLAVIGLGYVGLPLLVAFAGKRPVIGYDVDELRITELENGFDRNGEVSSVEFDVLDQINFTNDTADLRGVDCYIVAVPTPVSADNQPDLSLLISATEIVGHALKPGSIVIFESTVFPGVTEDICVPILEEFSGLKYNNDFFVGYSPERINPGDKVHTIKNIVKVVSGSNASVSTLIAELYEEVVDVGVHVAPSIKVAEAAKVIENTQRDINVALMNELSILFGLMGVNTWDVLAAAKTKWNFLPFEPGLVGGHCIGVDPYYLVYCAQQHAFNPEVMVSGRRTNDSMASYVAAELQKLLAIKNVRVAGARILVMGITFKENCPDFRNSQAVRVVLELKNNSAEVDIYDPCVNKEDFEKHTGLKLCGKPRNGVYGAILIAVKHKEFVAMTAGEIRSFGSAQAVIYDLKNILGSGNSDKTL